MRLDFDLLNIKIYAFAEAHGILVYVMLAHYEQRNGKCLSAKFLLPQLGENWW